MRHIWVLWVGIVAAPGCSSNDSSIQIAALEPQTTVSFDVVRRDQPTIREFTIQKPFLPAGRAELVGATGPFAPAPGELPRDAGSGIDFKLRIQYDPAAAGLSQLTTSGGSLRLRFFTPDGRLDATALVTLSAHAETATVPIVQTPIDFGGVAVDQRAVEYIAIRNENLATPVDVTSITISGGVFDVGTMAFPLQIPPASSRNVPVTYQPPALGDDAATAMVVTSVGNQTTSLRGSGVPSEVVLDLGFTAVDPVTGETPWIEFDVSAETASIHVEVVGDDPSADFLLTGFEGPNGTVYENDTLTGPYNWLKNFPTGFGALFLQLPNSDNPTVALVKGGGTYRLRFFEFTFSNPGFHIRVFLEQRHRGRVSDGVIPLNVFLADGLPVAAATAATHPDLQTILGTMDALLAPRGLRLGAVSYFDITNPAFDDIDSFSELDALQIESGMAPEARLNLFFVKTLDFGSGTTLGIAGALPGVKGNGHPYSGVVVDYDATPPAIVGSTAAHEAGHFLGLLHTTEFDSLDNIVDVDLIADTEICGLTEISAYCPTIGDSNLMWPYDLGIVNGLQLSLGQARVIKGHPLVEIGTVPTPPITLRQAQLAQQGLPIGVARHWCANCAGRVRTR